MDLMGEFKEKARKNPKRIVFPEGETEFILKAAELGYKEKIVFPTLLGNQEKIRSVASRLNINLEGINLVDPPSSPNWEKYISSLAEMSNLPMGASAKIMRRPVYFGAMMVQNQEMDGIIASRGIDDIIIASKFIIGMEKGISIPSSFLLMEIPGYSGGEKGLLLFADCAVNPDPTPMELADIAIASAMSAKELLGWEPRIAMLSFSTRGSGEHPHVDKVVEATKIIKDRAPLLQVEGEIQADAALVLEVAKKKIKDKRNPAAGMANILIFPDLDAGNIAYKLVQRLAKANAYGPILQGFAKPVSDLSRGATVEDIIGAVTLLVIRAQSAD